MAGDLIMRVGESVFGLTWESDMAIALDVPENALRRWAKGEEPPKPGLYEELALFVAERRDELEGAWRGAKAARLVKRKEPRPARLLPGPNTLPAQAGG